MSKHKSRAARVKDVLPPIDELAIPM